MVCQKKPWCVHSSSWARELPLQRRFRIVVRGKNVYACGSDERGALYGVERFVGCGWFVSQYSV
ncbi:MAG TPA: hypothetical protein PLJ32_07020 [Kiritimatiellia bacterium]|jgi:hypothetical protein|nr:hypothetical protein [Kiritimatiellia bacterium]